MKEIRTPHGLAPLTDMRVLVPSKALRAAVAAATNGRNASTAAKSAVRSPTALGLVPRSSGLPAPEVDIKMAIDKLKQSTRKFDETIDIAVQLGVDPRKPNQSVRGVVTLPNGTGKTVRVAVFARGVKAEEAKAAGATIVGAEDLVELVQSGKLEFDRCIATPDVMGLVGRVARVRDVLFCDSLGTSGGLDSLH